MSSLYRDFFGTRRPQGASNDIGAHELSETPACTREADYAAGLACVSGVCQACAAHGQCQSDACDLSAATSEGPGACLPEASVVYVDDQHCTLEGDGSRTNPICRIADAIAQTTTSRYAIRVYPGHYRLFGGVDGGTVYFFGPRDGSVFVEGEEDTLAAIRILHGARVVLDGLDFGGALSSAIRCEASDLKVLRSTTRAENAGIRATDCNLQVAPAAGREQRHRRARAPGVSGPRTAARRARAASVASGRRLCKQHVDLGAQRRVDQTAQDGVIGRRVDHRSRGPAAVDAGRSSHCAAANAELAWLAW